MQPKNSHDLRLKLAFVCKIIKCYLLVTRIQQITFRFFQCSKRFFYKISLFCNRSILSGNRSIWQNTDRPFLLRIVKEKLSVYVIICRKVQDRSTLYTINPKELTDFALCDLNTSCYVGCVVACPCSRAANSCHTLSAT